MILGHDDLSQSTILLLFYGIFNALFNSQILHDVKQITKAW